jgi:transposase
VPPTTAGILNKIRTAANRRPGYHFIHNAVNDYSRQAYSEVLTEEKKETVAGFRTRANAWFQSRGITVQRVLTDNGNGLPVPSLRSCPRT